MVKVKCRRRQTLVRKLHDQIKSEKGQERTQKPQNLLTVELRGANAEGHAAADQKHSEGLPTLSLCSDISYRPCSPCLARLQGSKGRVLPPPTATPAAPNIRNHPKFYMRTLPLGQGFKRCCAWCCSTLICPPYLLLLSRKRAAESCSCTGTTEMWINKAQRMLSFCVTRTELSTATRRPPGRRHLV